MIGRGMTGERVTTETIASDRNSCSKYFLLCAVFASFWSVAPAVVCLEFDREETRELSIRSSSTVGSLTTGFIGGRRSRLRVPNIVVVFRSSILDEAVSLRNFSRASALQSHFHGLKNR